MSDREEQRPSPEALLKRAQAEEATERPKLKIFIGYAPGVGKTFAMLEAARQRRGEGRDVVAAYVESHGRAETDALLEGLEVLPKASIAYMGVTLPEMDIDGVLARRPQIALVDELAHTNAPGSRHEKRWQDVEELLSAGIDVYTTVNVQHFESLNDIVAQITGVKVRETVPDRLLDEATEIRLVDIPPDDLLQRLHEGKVYIPEQAARAMETFFRPGNLIALRELSMRRAAARVDEEMRAYMETRAIAGPWPAAESLLVCVSGSPFSERLIRTTRRLADEMKVAWHTVYIDTPDAGRQVRENRERVWRDLRLAETLGATVATVTAPAVAPALIDYAVRHNVTRIVVGKPSRPRWREFLRTPLVDQVIRQSGAIDVYVVSLDGAERKAEPATARPQRGKAWLEYLKSLVLVLAATAASELAYQFLSPTNLVMIYLLAVVLAATRLGRKPAVMTAFLGVLAFDFFFVPPRFTFAVTDSEYIITFAALFIVGVVISTLVARSRERAEAMRVRELQTASLYYLSRDLAAAADIDTVTKALVRHAAEALEAQVALLLPEGEKLVGAPGSAELPIDAKEGAVADWAYRNRQPAGRGTETLVSARFIFLPLQTTDTVLGVMGVSLTDETQFRSREHRRLLDAFASQTAMAMERVQLVSRAEQAQLLAARETLERSLLNSISHDLRTPLAAITGALSGLKADGGQLSEANRRALLDTAGGEADRLNRFVGNLLDLTRIEAGAMKLKREPCEVQELVGCALTALEARLADREVHLRMLPIMPLVPMDLVFMTQVLVNLLENALKYTSADSPIDIVARTDAAHLLLQVDDRGPGVPEGDLERIFDKFYRIPVPEGAGGTGLGLSICRGIVEAHGGTIRAKNRPDGGLGIVITLPLGEGGVG